MKIIIVTYKYDLVYLYKCCFLIVLFIVDADPWKVTIFFSGIALFFLSPQLAKSTTFFYSSATLVGALGAALLVLFLFSKFLPRVRTNINQSDNICILILKYDPGSSLDLIVCFHRAGAHM